MKNFATATSTILFGAAFVLIGAFTLVTEGDRFFGLGCLLFGVITIFQGASMRRRSRNSGESVRVVKSLIQQRMSLNRMRVTAVAEIVVSICFFAVAAVWFSSSDTLSYVLAEIAFGVIFLVDGLRGLRAFRNQSQAFEAEHGTQAGRQV